MFARQGDEQPDMIGGMLSVRIHGHDMREALRMGQSQPVQNGGAFALIAWQRQDTQIGVIHVHASKFLAGPVGAAVDDHPDRPFLSTDGRDSGK